MPAHSPADLAGAFESGRLYVSPAPGTAYHGRCRDVVIGRGMMLIKGGVCSQTTSPEPINTIGKKKEKGATGTQSLEYLSSISMPHHHDHSILVSVSMSNSPRTFSGAHPHCSKNNIHLTAYTIRAGRSAAIPLYQALSHSPCIFTAFSCP